MKQIAVYARSGRPGPDAFIEGARVAGLRVVQQRPIFNPRDGLVANIAAVFTDGLRGDCLKVRDAYRDAGIPVYIMDLPRLRAAVGPDDSANAIGLYLNELSDLPIREANSVVVAGVLERPNPDIVLVCGQKPGDAAHGMDDTALTHWATMTIEHCRELFPGMTIVYRPHPRAIVAPSDMFGADGISHPAEHDLRYALQRAIVCVVYNSTAGVDAIDAGVPVAYTAPASQVCYREFAAPLGDELRVLTAQERAAFLRRCGASQWTLEQLRDGTLARCMFLGQPYPKAELVTSGNVNVSAEVSDAVDERSEEPIRQVTEAAADVVEESATSSPPVDVPNLPPIAQLADVLARTDDGNVILAMQARDTRKTAQPLYEARLSELTAPSA